MFSATRCRLAPCLLATTVHLATTDSLALAQDTHDSKVMLEEVRVMGRHTGLHDSNEGAGQWLNPDMIATPPPSIAALLVEQPGVSYSGQGGLFQTVSVRGLSGQRVANYFLDIPILTERRAGTSSSFIDPAMIAGIELLKGPASTYYGSGAMGGVLQIRPRRAESVTVNLDWATAGDENLQYIGAGDDTLQAAFSHRGANDSRDSSGNELHTQFEQYNAALGWNNATRPLKLSFDTLVSYGDDIGKSNNRYPTHSSTDYPRERHWLGQFSADYLQLWHASVFFHSQELATSVDRVQGEDTRVNSEAFDLGASGYARLGSQQWPLRLGVDYLARRNVRAHERRWSDSGEPILAQDNLDAEQDQLGLFTDTETSVGTTRLSGGLRVAYITQKDDNQHTGGSGRESDSAVSGFARALWPATEHTQWRLELASGLRFPTLSERYFNGTTGRGLIEGNPTLDPEQSRSIELGLETTLDVAELTLQAYYMKVDDFISRVDAGPETLTFINIGEGEIRGAEFTARVPLGAALAVSLAGHYLESEDNQGDPLQDVAPNKISTGLNFEAGQLHGKLLLEHRFERRSVAPGETPVDSANLLSASLSWQLSNTTSLSVWGRNLLDERYQLTSDDLSTQGQERAFGVRLAWQR